MKKTLLALAAIMAVNSGAAFAAQGDHMATGYFTWKGEVPRYTFQESKGWSIVPALDSKALDDGMLHFEALSETTARFVKSDVLRFKVIETDDPEGNPAATVNTNFKYQLTQLNVGINDIAGATSPYIGESITLNADGVPLTESLGAVAFTSTTLDYVSLDVNIIDGQDDYPGATPDDTAKSLILKPQDFIKVEAVIKITDNAV